MNAKRWNFLFGSFEMWKIFAFLSLAQLCFCNVRLSRRLFQQGLGSPALQFGVELPPDQWFDQVLDHSRPGDDRTWKQRFRVSDKYYRPGGPAFLMIGGEGPANAAWMEAGSWIKASFIFRGLYGQIFRNSTLCVPANVVNLMFRKNI